MQAVEREIVLITTRTTPETEHDPIYTQIGSTYIRALENAGFLPLIVSPAYSERNFKDMYKMCAAVVFTGGRDWNPKLYGQEPHPETQEPQDDRQCARHPRRTPTELTCPRDRGRSPS